MDSLKNAISVSVNHGNSVDLVGLKGLNDDHATTVMVLVDIFLSCPRTCSLSHSPTPNMTVTDNTPITNPRILKNVLIGLMRRSCNACRI